MIKARIGTITDIPAVLALQEKYLFRNMSEKEREQGFVTTPFTPSQIELIITQNGLFIAENDEKVIVSYVFAADWRYFSQWEIFNYMISRFPKLSFQGVKITSQNTFQYGPICIDMKYRRIGVMNIIIEKMRLEFVKRFPISVTFINQLNEISAHAHKKMGWEVIDNFEFNENKYLGLAIAMNKSVL